MSDGALYEWRGKAIGLLDLDAFFASVEQLDHPEWRGLPVIVGGSAERRGVVSTASYEARVYGVHSAMPAAQARRLCPQAIWTQGHYSRYREMSDAVMDLLGAETPYVEQVSIDEAFFDVTPGRYAKESPVDICRRVQERVAELGVTCSIGLGTSKAVAKIASERVKPRGLTVVWPGSEREFLAPLPVRALSGIGPATEQRLHALGVGTLGALASSDLAEMERLFGSHGRTMVLRARGEEGSAVGERAVHEAPKSVSNERTFAHDLTSAADVHAALDTLSQMVGTRLRRAGLRGRQVSVKLLFAYRQGKTAQSQLPRATDDESVFGPVARELLAGLWREGTPVRLLGVGMAGFAGQDEPEQQRLFGDDLGAQPQDDGARRKLSVTTDELRERFGKGAISYGRELRLGSEPASGDRS